LFEGEVRILALAALMSCVCRSWKAAVDTWLPPVDRAARLRRLEHFRNFSRENIATLLKNDARIAALQQL